MPELIEKEGHLGETVSVAHLGGVAGYLNRSGSRKQLEKEELSHVLRSQNCSLCSSNTSVKAISLKELDKLRNVLCESRQKLCPYFYL